MRNLLLVMLTLLFATEPLPAQFSFQCQSTPLTLNANNLVRSSSVFVSERFSITDLQVFVNVTHSAVGDLRIFVTSPSGTIMQLHDGGGADNDDLRLTFASAGAPNGTPNYQGDNLQQPAPDPWALLNALQETSSGEWTLQIEDVVGGLHDGVLNEWCLFATADQDPFPPTGLFCLPFNLGEAASIAWDNHAPYTDITVYADGIPVGTIPGDVNSASLDFSIGALSTICLEANIDGTILTQACCNVTTSLPPQPDSLQCQVTNEAVEMQWQNMALYDAIEIYENNTLIATLAGNVQQASAPRPTITATTYCVAGILGGLVSDLNCCGPLAASMPQFVRGDVDNDGAFTNLIDPIVLLSFGFLGGATPACIAAADIDGDLDLNPLLDAVWGLAFGFQGGPPPPAPFPTCGVDIESVDVLSCVNGSCPAL